jgi:hypothetical protein
MDLATVDKLLTTTRTVRKRLELTGAVPHDVIEHCLEIAIQAPTGGAPGHSRTHSPSSVVTCGVLHG